MELVLFRVCPFRRERKRLLSADNTVYSRIAMKQSPKNVDEYMRALEPDALESLSALRKEILETVPEAEETMRSQMPVSRSRNATSLFTFATPRSWRVSARVSLI
jgi:hypothetical protein